MQLQHFGELCSVVEMVVIQGAIAIGTILYVVRKTHTEVYTVFREIRSERITTIQEVKE